MVTYFRNSVITGNWTHDRKSRVQCRHHYTTEPSTPKVIQLRHIIYTDGIIYNDFTWTVFISPSRNVCSGCRKSFVDDAMKFCLASPSFCSSSPHWISLLPALTHHCYDNCCSHRQIKSVSKLCLLLFCSHKVRLVTMILIYNIKYNIKYY